MLYRDLDPLVRRTASHLYLLRLAQGEVVGVALKDSVGSTPEEHAAQIKSDRDPWAKIAKAAKLKIN